MSYKLCRLKPFNPRNPTPRTYTIIASARYPKGMTFAESKGWYKVPVSIADNLELEMVDTNRVFDVCTHTQAMAIDRAEALAKERRNQRAAATNPHTLARPSASEWAADPDFAAEVKPARRAPSAVPAAQEWDEDVAPTPAKHRAPAPEDAFPSPDDELAVFGEDAAPPHPAATIGDEDDAEDSDESLVAETSATELESPAPVVEEPVKRPRGRPRKQ